MKNNMRNNIIKYTLYFIIILFLVIIRIPKESAYYKDCDATYHTLLTMKCYDETPKSIHKFLPIVSLGEVEDKNISWGECVKDDNGNYYYTSFSSAGFVLPYLFVKLLHLPINIYSLYAFNSLIYIITYILITFIFCKLFSKYLNKDIIILFTTLIYLFQLEVMHSLGVIYWSQSIFHLLIATQFILFMNYKNKIAKTFFFIMCLIMPYVEWTGYITNIGFSIIIFLKQMKQKSENDKSFFKIYRESILIIVLTLLSFGIFSMHYLLNIDFNDYILALKNRFFARNFTNSEISIIDLLKGYLYSYCPMIILCGIMFIVILNKKKYRNKLIELLKEYIYETIFFSFMMLENVIMMQHAIVYTFDRLKLIYILLLAFYIMLSVICICNEKSKEQILCFITVILVIISIINVNYYPKCYFKYYVTVNEDYNKNQEIAQYIKDNFNHSNSVICSSNSVRGYMNLLFERGIYECVTYGEAQNIAKQFNKQYLVYIYSMGEMNIMKVYIENIVTNEEYEIYFQNNQVIIR